MNYAIVFLGAIIIFSTIYYWIQGRKYYTGPIIEAEIEEDSRGERSSEEGAKGEKKDPPRELPV